MRLCVVRRDAEKFSARPSREILIVDPRVGFLQPLAERGIRLPMQMPLNERVVAVAAVHALVSSPRGRHADVDAVSHGLTQPPEVIDGDSAVLIPMQAARSRVIETYNNRAARARPGQRRYLPVKRL